MEEVIKLIYEIQSIIESQKAKNKEKIGLLEDAKQTLLERFTDKNQEFEDLMAKYQELVDNFNTVSSEKEELTNSFTEKSEAFREKTLGTVKYLVSTIEKLESELENKKSEIENMDIPDLSQYVPIKKYNTEISALKSLQEKTEREKQTALENTWKEQKELARELADKTKEITKLSEENSRLNNSIDTLTDENNMLKLKNIEAERKSENFDQLVKLNDELTLKVNELSTTLERICQEHNNKVPQIKRRMPEDDKSSIETTNKPVEVKDTNTKETAAIKGTAPYHFGITSKTVIDKLTEFINEIYNNSTKSQDNSFTILSNLRQAKEKIGLTDQEYDVFVNRLQEMEGPNGMPLLVITDNKARSYFSRDWMIQYVSTIA